MGRLIQKPIRRAILVLGIALGFPAAALAGWSGFLRLDGISGESRNTNYFGWIEVSSVSSGFIRTSTNATGTPFCFEKKLDLASPRLVFDCAESMPISSGELDLTDSTGRQFLRLDLSDIVILSNQVSGSSQSDSRPDETVCMATKIVSWTYTETNPSSGLPIGYVTNTLNFANNTGAGGVKNPVFVVTGIRRDNEVELSWLAVAGKRYHIYAVTRLDAPFTFLVDALADADGKLTRSISPVGSAMFFVVEKAD